VTRSADRGELALVLHSHMPYVEGFGTWPFGEEWLWEAVATVYLPLLDVLADVPSTLTLTPVLCDQLETLPVGAGERFLAFLGDVRAPIHAEDAAGLERGGHGELAAELRRAAEDYERARREFERRDGRLVEAFADLASGGAVELWTSCATHAVVPLLATDAGFRLQVETALASHERRFGSRPRGFWLPECAYGPGLADRLPGSGVGAFCVDQSDAWGVGSLDHLEPVATEAGGVAVPIDWATVSLVWDASSGYPVHAAYRDYHARTIHDLKPWNNGGGAYHHADAVALAREHARDFVDRTLARLDAFRAERGRPGLVCCALDTELLGHWWYEGPQWLAAVVQEARSRGLALTALGDAVERRDPAPRPLAPATWGTPKDLTTWDSPSVEELTWTARSAELELVRPCVTRAARAGSPALARAARELLAIQASDWAFLATRELAGDYPLERVRAHKAALDAALAALKDSPLVDQRGPEPSLRNLAPDLETWTLLANG
jgi:1,4-alpha-glucan branching enzyme